MPDSLPPSAPAPDSEDALLTSLAGAIRERGLTLAEVSARSGVAAPHVSRALAGRRRLKLETFLRLASGAGLRVVLEDAPPTPPARRRGR